MSASTTIESRDALPLDAPGIVSAASISVAVQNGARRRRRLRSIVAPLLMLRCAGLEPGTVNVGASARERHARTREWPTRKARIRRLDDESATSHVSVLLMGPPGLEPGTDGL